MQKIRLICIGKLRERFFQDASKEYQKRLSRYIDLSVEEIDDLSEPENADFPTIRKVVEKEGEAILRRIKSNDFVIGLFINGKTFTSEELASLICQKAQDAVNLVFIIGGSNGLSAALEKRADLKLSFSSFTFPHQLMRVILLEQIYRSCKINSNERYHK